jgi:hypothetical protein
MNDTTACSRVSTQRACKKAVQSIIHTPCKCSNSSRAPFVPLCRWAAHTWAPSPVTDSSVPLWPASACCLRAMVQGCGARAHAGGAGLLVPARWPLAVHRIMGAQRRRLEPCGHPHARAQSCQHTRITRQPKEHSGNNDGRCLLYVVWDTHTGGTRPHS